MVAVKVMYMMIKVKMLKEVTDTEYITAVISRSDEKRN